MGNSFNAPLMGLPIIDKPLLCPLDGAFICPCKCDKRKSKSKQAPLKSEIKSRCMLKHAAVYSLFILSLGATPFLFLNGKASMLICALSTTLFFVLFFVYCSFLSVLILLFYQFLIERFRMFGFLCTLFSSTR